MESIIETFHLDIKLFLAQLVNFTIVFLVLYFFALKPLIKIMQERAEKIEKGLSDAREAQKKLIEMEQKEKAVLQNTRLEAQKIIGQAQEVASKNKEEIIFESKNHAQKILAEAQKKIEKEKEKLFQEVKSELGALVVLATEKMLAEKIDKEKDQQLIKKAIE